MLPACHACIAEGMIVGFSLITPNSACKGSLGWQTQACTAANTAVGGAHDSSSFPYAAPIEQVTKLLHIFGVVTLWLIACFIMPFID